MDSGTKQQILLLFILLIAMIILISTYLTLYNDPDYECYDKVIIELREHLHADYPITIFNIDLMKRDTEGLWLFEVIYYNNEEHISFKEYCKFNFQTKEIIGYDRLKYV